MKKKILAYALRLMVDLIMVAGMNRYIPFPLIVQEIRGNITTLSVVIT